MKRLLVPAVMLAIAVTGLQTVSWRSASAEPPDQWLSHPPIHVRGNASATKPSGYSPAQIRAAYGLSQLDPSVNGSGQVIAIIDAYDAPTIQNDLQFFINYFGLPPMNFNCTVAAGPHPCFQKVYASGSAPRSDSGWALETSLDVEWSHVIAPGADILLVEARSNLTTDLISAVDRAVALGAKVVSMSWGGGESSGQLNLDSHFNVPGVTFLASSGDSGTGVIWPSASPYVIAVGGTTLVLTSNGTVTSETAWSGSGGGKSLYENQPGYQSAYGILSNGRRAVPDVSLIANPNPGVSVYDTTSYQGVKGWFAVGGTSASAPQWAGLIALANQGRAVSLSSSSLSSSPVYFTASPPLSSAYATNYRDITSGSDGTCSTCTAVPGYDFVTGLGSPRANALIPALRSY